MSGDRAPGVDSRRWTGRKPAPPAPDERAARAAFRAAGGPGALAPQGAAAAVFWAGLLLMLPVILVGADRDTWLLGLEPLAPRVRAGLEEWLAVLLRPEDVGRVIRLIGDPRLLAALLAIAGSLAGIAAARRHRAALARGFEAAAAEGSGEAFTTLGHWEAAPLMLLLVGLEPLHGPWLAGNALALWLLARLSAASVTSVAERRAAGLGTRGVLPSRWDLATITVSLGVMLLMLANAWGVFR